MGVRLHTAIHDTCTPTPTPLPAPPRPAPPARTAKITSGHLFTASDEDGEGSNSESGDDGESRADEDVLAVQAREAEKASLDVSGSLLGSLVGLLSREIARDAVSSSAAAKVKAAPRQFHTSDRTCHTDPAP